MKNIKYFKEMVMPTSTVDGYFIEFMDGSELEISFYDGGYFSTTDCTNGNHRNLFKKSNDVDDVITKLKSLKQQLGVTKTNKGNVILVDSSTSTTQTNIN